MKFITVFVASVLAIGVKSQDLCDTFEYENENFGLCSHGHDFSTIWNKTSNDVVARVQSDFNIVSFSSTIFTFGCVTAVRKDIGSQCWDNSNVKIASFMIDNGDFETEIVCNSYPYSSPSIIWEGRYQLETVGYKNCADLAIVYEEILKNCTRFHHDGVFWASLGYLLLLYLIVYVALSLCGVGK